MSLSNELTAEEFFRQFKNKLYDQNAVDEEKRSYRETYLSNEHYTNLINRHIVPDILKQFGMDYSNEYYRIDVTGRVNDTNKELGDEFSNAQFNYHSWRLKVAFEHENNSTDWSDEVIKLLYVNCPLKIVVGYNYANNRNALQFGDERKLDLLARTITHLGVEIKDEFMIILGNCGEGYKEENEAEKYFGYRAYLYDSDSKSFKPLGI